jgi:hypothetical protein
MFIGYGSRPGRPCSAHRLTRRWYKKELGYECQSVAFEGLTDEGKRSEVWALNLARRQLDNDAKRRIIVMVSGSTILILASW